MIHGFRFRPAIATLFAIALLTSCLSACGVASPDPAASGDAAAVEAGPSTSAASIPPEVLANWRQLLGTWVADNSAYQSADDPYDAYAIDWSWGIDERSLVGRLYGLQAGRDVGTFWEFREFWHPGDATVMAIQFGVGGTYGAGPHTFQGDGASEMEQTFFRPADGVTFRVGHRSRLAGDEHMTASFDIGPDGVWTPRRSYTWIRQPAGG
jgi:hypothetical protein